jgi:hypothetical protein
VITGGSDNIVRGDFSAVPGGSGNNATGIGSFAAGTGSQALHNGTFLWSDDASPVTALKSTAANRFLVRATGGVTFYSNAKLTAGFYYMLVQAHGHPSVIARPK